MAIRGGVGHPAIEPTPQEAMQGIIGYIVQHEAAGDYDRWNNGTRLRPQTPLTKMTVGEVLHWQARNKRLPQGQAFTAAGGIQMIHDTLLGHVRAGHVSTDDLYDVVTQQKLAVIELQQAGAEEWFNGTKSTEDFGTSVAKVWASLPVLKDTYRGKRFVPYGHGYYGGVSTNPSVTSASAESFKEVLSAPATKPKFSDHYKVRSTSPGRYKSQGLPTQERDMWPTHKSYWDVPDVDMTPKTRMDFGDGPVEVQSARDRDIIYDDPLAATYSKVQPSSAPPVLPTYLQGIQDAWQDSGVVRSIKDKHGSNTYYDNSFDQWEAIEQDNLGDHWRYLGQARSKEHYEFLKSELERGALVNRRRNAGYGFGAEFLGYMAAPESVASLFLPGAAGVSATRSIFANAARSGAVLAGAVGGVEYGAERLRAPLDPFSTEVDGIVRVGSSVLFTGLISGAIGGYMTKSARHEFARKFADEIAAERGVGAPTPRYDINGRSYEVVADGRRFTPEYPPLARERGAVAINGYVYIDEGRILSRFKDKSYLDDGLTPEFKNPNELMEYEARFAIAMEQAQTPKPKGKGAATRFMGDEEGALKLPEFLQIKDHELKVNRARLQKALKEGESLELGPARGSGMDGKIKPVEIKSAFIKNVDEAEAIVRAAHEIANKARDSLEFREMLAAKLYDFGKRADNILRDDPIIAAQRQERILKAHQAAREAVEAWNTRNNRIIRSARAEAFARLSDSPYKRLHRNSYSAQLRDLADKLVADGGFLRGTDGDGLSVGTSVWSRAKTWDGVVRKMWDAETKLYEKYLGFGKSNLDAGDVAVNKSFRQKRVDGSKAIGVKQFRHEVSTAYITGKRHEIPEVNEMVEHLRAGWMEYKDVAEEYGVLQSLGMIDARIANLDSQMSRHFAQGQPLQYDPKRLDELKASRENILREREFAERQVSEEYFTRVYNQRAIVENREAFKENVVKPWMRQQPYVDVWEVGALELQQEMTHLRANGGTQAQIDALQARIDVAPPRSTWKTVKASQKPADIDARANKIIDTILEEAEPEELGILREAHRPSFGRSRQFDIPNSHLLKDGPNGNGVADFMNTDYMLVHEIYAQRMGPAIEMARTFSRPLDGVSAADGFAEAIHIAKGDELRVWLRKGKTEDAFNDHWAPMERDLLHLRDRVLNRVARKPDRWDNRAAAVLKDWSITALMGRSGLSVVNELGALVVKHGIERPFKVAFGKLDEATTRAFSANIDEMREAGGIMDVVSGGALAHFSETGMDPVRISRPEAMLKVAANKMFLFSGMAPLTSRLKEIDAAIRVHDTVKKIHAVSDGTATRADIEYLDRFGISSERAAQMAEQPIFRTPEGHWQANTPAWGDEGLVRDFRAAIRQGNENTILLATAADKPIMVDGTMYIRKHDLINGFAQRAGLEEAGDYWRVHSGLLSLPFGFWNYSLAAFNKIAVANMDEPSTRALAGIVSMIGLGYITAQVATPAYMWDQLSMSDRLVRAIDKSGVMGVIGNYRTLLQNSAIGATGINPLPIEPQYGHEPSGWDAVFDVAGAGPGTFRSAVLGAGEVMSGDNRGWNKVGWATPYRHHIAIGGLLDSFNDGYERRAQN